MTDAPAGWRARLASMLAASPDARIGLSYAVRTTLAALASLVLCRALHIVNPVWAIVSAVVTILPEQKASIGLAAVRVVANLVGAAVGVAVGFLPLPEPLLLAIGLVAVALCCRVLNIDATARTASVTVVIVLNVDAHGRFGSSETRVMLVFSAA